MALADDITKAQQNFAKLNAFMNGDADGQVQTDGGAIPTLAGVIAASGNKLAAAIAASSSSTVNVAVGARSFQVAADKAFKTGQWVTATAAGASMTGTVTSYSGTTLVVNVTRVTGTGSANLWSISLSGMVGKDGPEGPAGTGGGGGGAPATPELLITKFPWE